MRFLVTGSAGTGGNGDVDLRCEAEELGLQLVLAVGALFTCEPAVGLGFESRFGGTLDLLEVVGLVPVGAALVETEFRSWVRFEAVEDDASGDLGTIFARFSLFVFARLANNASRRAVLFISSLLE